MALKYKEASSSEDPPDKKVTPGRAGTIVLDKVLTVYIAISPAVALVACACPGVTIFGFKRHPSIRSL